MWAALGDSGSSSLASVALLDGLVETTHGGEEVGVNQARGVAARIELDGSAEVEVGAFPVPVEEYLISADTAWASASWSSISSASADRFPGLVKRLVSIHDAVVGLDQIGLAELGVGESEIRVEVDGLLEVVHRLVHLARAADHQLPAPQVELVRLRIDVVTASELLGDLVRWAGY